MMSCPLGSPVAACQDGRMRLSLTLIFLTFGHMAAACEMPMRLVDLDTPVPSRIPAFEETRSDTDPQGSALNNISFGKNPEPS